jgi:hypothetical protein
VLASVARPLKVSRQSVSRWYQPWEKGGARALQSAGRAGRKSRLSPRPLKQLETALLRGPAAQGWSAELSIAARGGRSFCRPRVTGYKLNGFPAMHPISILPSRCGTTARAQNWRTSARINGLKPTKLSVTDDSDSVIPGVCPTPSCNTQAFPFEHLSLYYAKLNNSGIIILPQPFDKSDSCPTAPSAGPEHSPIGTEFE